MDTPAKSEYEPSSRSASLDDDDRELEALGYKPSFKREFSNLSTISFAFSIMGLCSSIATTFNTPLLTGGPASVTWCWILGATMCFTLGASIAEIVSAFPTCGGLYTASAQLCPPKHRAIVGWIVGWLNIMGQIAGVSSTEFGLSNMIWAAVVAVKPDYEITSGKAVGLFIGLLIVHGILNSLATRYLAKLTTGFVFVNLGTTAVIVIAMLAKTPRSEMHPASYVFGSAGITNQTGLDGHPGWPTGLAFLFGLLSVQWTMTDYDATAHISEEVRRAAYAAPSAIFIAVLGTGIFGWILNIVMVLCSGPLENLDGATLTFLQILVLRLGRDFALAIWVFVCLTAFFVVQTALQATSRTMYSLSRDHGLPDWGFFGHVSTKTHTPLRSIWLCTIIAILPGLLYFASPIATYAIFALTAMALDASYVIPITLRRVYRNHPEVHFKPGPFYMGDGVLGWTVNIICIFWTCFVIVILALPTLRPVTADNMNYAAPITVGVIVITGIWYIFGARKHYKGPISNLQAHANKEEEARTL